VWHLNPIDQQLVDLALAEDLGQPFVDVTTQRLFPAAPLKTARIISKHDQPIVICGLTLIDYLFSRLNPHCVLETAYQDGAVLPAGATLATLTGPADALLMGERSALNFLRHLSAIATLTAQFVDAVKPASTKILDTRKTTPGFRHLEKVAVQCGGGVNHRLGLYDAIMLKDTHIDLLGGMQATLPQLLVDKPTDLPVIVEARSPQELEVVLPYQQQIDRVLLDNMSVPMLQHCVAMCHGKIATEASGNITLSNIAAIAATGVDFASVGMLTYAAGQVDLSMQI